MTNQTALDYPQNNQLTSQTLRWFTMAAFASALSIFLHECAHYLTALALGASDVVFHWAEVSHDAASVSSASNAAIALAGPILSYGLVIVAYVLAKRSASPFVLGLGFAGAFRAFGMLPYTIRTLLGRDISTFYFDEVRGATALGISPMILVSISLAVFLGGTVYFGRKTQQQSNFFFMLVMIIGTFAGAYAWSLVGPLFFPGGVGFN